jgi:HD-like signal output (HDOD) protein
MSPKSLVQNIHTLYSLPDVVLRVNQLINEPNTRTEQLAQAILCDPGLAARLLKLVNSAYYGSRRRIETVSHAIVLLGHRELRDLVIATVAVNMFEGLPPDQVNMDRFWQHSVMAGLAARGLAQRLHLRQGEHFFIAGLLHGVGKLIFYSQYPDRYHQVLERAGPNPQARVAAERQVFGFTYADLSAELLKSWRLLDLMHVAIAHHLEPSKALDHRREATILFVAVQIANDMQTSVGGVSSPAPAEPDPERFAALAKQLGLPPESLASLPAEIALHSKEIFETIRPGATQAS